MAARTIALSMTPTEEKALARLIGYLCKTEDEVGQLAAILGQRSLDIEEIGRVNAALNANR